MEEETIPSDFASTTDGDSSDGFLNDATGGRVDRFSFLSMGSPKLQSWLPLDLQWDKGSQKTLCFSSHSQLLDHVTRNWRSNFVTVDLDTRDAVEMFTKRPFFMLISVDAPLLDRYRRSKKWV
jgi:dCMP deaminase